MSVGLHGAAQIWRPPRDGMPYLRSEELVGEPGSLAIDGGVITESVSMPDMVIDASGCAIVPGFVDCHTHLPFAGWRANEYEMKVTGVPYEEIARSGGGIRASAKALANATDAAVLSQAGALAVEMLAHGTTTFECKTGYGLSVEAEERLLDLFVGLDVWQTTTSTALLAHAVPDGFTADSWMDAIAPIAGEGAATALDIYVESIAFTNEHLKRMGELAKEHGRDLRAHVEQFNANRSTPVALEAGARSVDHLACLHPDDIAPLAAAECAAVLLPGAEFMGNEQLPPARELLDAQAICVLATDLNPGTSPIASLPLIIGLAVRRYGWSARRALAAVTLNAAWVLRLHETLGSLEVGKRADVVLLDGPLEHVPYRFGHNPVAMVFVGGELVHARDDQDWRIAR